MWQSGHIFTKPKVLFCVCCTLKNVTCTLNIIFSLPNQRFFLKSLKEILTNHVCYWSGYWGLEGIQLEWHSKGDLWTDIIHNDPLGCRLGLAPIPWQPIMSWSERSKNNIYSYNFFNFFFNFFQFFFFTIFFSIFLIL